MSSETIIEVSGLGKCFPVYDKPHHRLLQMFFRKRRLYREFQALRDVSMHVKRGETVGIVGRNGSGKSTLLQIICGTLTPTSGEVSVQGRVAALLELGAGFNPDFTGRENVYMNAAVMNITRSEVAERLDDILAFADIGEFIDRPVKTYSSGMYVRLAFAVAIHVEPDILVVDEALSVGDEAFQRKCFARIEQLRRQGCSILFVSHAASTVIELCDRAVLLDGGELLAEGKPKSVISLYQRMIYATAERVIEMREQLKRTHQLQASEPDSEHIGMGHGFALQAPKPTDDASEPEAYFDEGMKSQSTLAYASRGARIEDPHIETPQGDRVNVIRAGERYVYTYIVAFEHAADAVRFGMLIKTTTGVELAGAVSAQPEQAIGWVEAGSRLSVRFEFVCRLAPGAYFMNAGVHGRVGEGETYLDRRIDALMFRVMGTSNRLSTGFVDLVDAAGWETIEHVTEREHGGEG